MSSEALRPDEGIPAIIYSAVSPATLLSRAWNLLRYHLKPSILLMMIPAFLGVLSSLLMLLPSALKGMAGVNSFSLFIVAFVLGVLLLYFTILVRFFCLAGLARMYYHTLVEGTVISLRESFKRAVKSRSAFLAMLLLFSGTLLLGTGFVVLDVVAFFVGMIGVYVLGAFLMVALVVPNAIFQIALLIVALGVFIMGSAFIALVLIAMMSFQGAVCLFPAVSVANTNQTGFLATLEEGLASYRLLTKNWVRVVLFGILLYVLYMVLSLALMLPLQVWFLLEIIFNPGTDPAALMPIHKSLIMSVYQALVFSVIWPFIFAGATLLWYDCRVRSEGLDIRLLLHRMSERLRVKSK